jgi:hypothetical protein
VKNAKVTDYHMVRYIASNLGTLQDYLCQRDTFP